MRYILDNSHPDHILFLKDLFKNEEFLVKDFYKDYDLSFLTKDDCLVLGVHTVLRNPELFFKIKQNYLCFTLNYLPPDHYTFVGQRKNCKGFISSSIENQIMITSLGMKSFFAPLIYPRLKKKLNSNFNCNQISTLINNYELYGKDMKIDSFSSYEAFQFVKEQSGSHLKLYDSSTNQFGKDIDILMNTKFYLHIKYWGHVCNAPLKALSMGVPVIMDKTTYQIGCFSYYLKDGFNCIIANNLQEIISSLRTQEEPIIRLKSDIFYKNLKMNCLNSRQNLVNKHSGLFRSNFKGFLKFS